jgi:hypothetical protein
VSSVEATELEKQDVKSVVLVVEESDDEEGAERGALGGQDIGRRSFHRCPPP